jgi:hypothetical protein
MYEDINDYIAKLYLIKILGYNDDEIDYCKTTIIKNTIIIEYYNNGENEKEEIHFGNLLNFMAKILLELKL